MLNKIEELARTAERWERQAITDVEKVKELENSHKATDALVKALDAKYLAACEEIKRLGQATTTPKEGTWAWASESAFKNPGKRYAYGDDMDEWHMEAKTGMLMNRWGQCYVVGSTATTATDWREVPSND
jgi:hypothetical protein